MHGVDRYGVHVARVLLAVFHSTRRKSVSLLPQNIFYFVAIKRQEEGNTCFAPVNMNSSRGRHTSKVAENYPKAWKRIIYQTLNDGKRAILGLDHFHTLPTVNNFGL